MAQWRERSPLTTVACVRFPLTGVTIEFVVGSRQGWRNIFPFFFGGGGGAD